MSKTIYPQKTSLSKKDEDRIQAIMEYFIKNTKEVHPRLIEEIKDYLSQNLDEFPSGLTASSLAIKKKYITGTANLNQYSVKWWTARGWEKKEAEIKVIEYKINHKRTMVSPFSREFWLAKGLTEEEADHKRNSMRPIRKEYWINQGFSLEDAINLAKETQRNNTRKGVDKVKLFLESDDQRKIYNNSLRVEYYIIRGFSEEEAERKLHERQQTFTLEKCIEKYGEEEGTKVWQARQDKWQNTLQSRDDYEEIKKRRDSVSLQFFQKKYPDDPEKALEEYKKRIDKIDSASLQFFQKKYPDDPEKALEEYKKRSSFLRYGTLEYFQEKFPDDPKRVQYEFNKSLQLKPWCNLECPIEEDVPGILYYIHFWNDDIEFWKIGVTRKTIGERFWTKDYSAHYNLNKKVLGIMNGLYINECHKLEQKILGEMIDHRIAIDYNGFKTTEAFSCNIFEAINEHFS